MLFIVWSSRVWQRVCTVVGGCGLSGVTYCLGIRRQTSFSDWKIYRYTFLIFGTLAAFATHHIIWLNRKNVCWHCRVLRYTVFSILMVSLFWPICSPLHLSVENLQSVISIKDYRLQAQYTDSNFMSLKLEVEVTVLYIWIWDFTFEESRIWTEW